MSKPSYLFEVSYEVCNKVGGIYSLLRSKSHHMTDQYGESYFAIGPYVKEKADLEFQERPPSGKLSEVIDGLVPDGIKCHYGRWMTESRPNAILIDYSGYRSRANDIKKELWEFAEVDSLFADEWFNDPLIWSTTAGILLDRIAESEEKGKNQVAQFHEWLSGGGLLKTKELESEIATVFTTHATVLGRALAGYGEPVHEIVEAPADKEKNLELAREHKVLGKHTMELASAKHADVFTTVSEVTGKEAEHFLGRKPDILVPGGIDLDKYPSMDEITIKRRANRRHMRNFLMAYFGRYYHIDLYNIRSMFISGRYEFHNKGIDLFIDALGRLNERMKKEKTKRKVVSFLWIPSGVRGEDFQVLKNKSVYEEIKDRIDELIPEVEEEIIHSITEGGTPKHVFDQDIMQELRNIGQHFADKRGENPPLCAFELAYPQEQDQIIQAFRKNGLLNREEDCVKVIYYPAYLSPTDGLISLEYNQATMTCDIGVFPSYYEPWGYTPLETAALGGLAITTDLAGFGKFIEGKGKGIYVLKRQNRSMEDAVEDLTDKLYEVVNMPKEELSEEKISARKLSALADWRHFIKNYYSAYEKALTQKKKAR